MDKKRYLNYLKLFGFSFYNDDLHIDESFNIENIKTCKMCNLYKSKEKFYINKTKKSKIFILSEDNFNDSLAKEFDFIIQQYLKLSIKNTYFTGVVKCSNFYKKEHLTKCYQYSLNEILYSEASILILLGESLKNILQLDSFRVGDLIFYNFNNKKIKILINYGFNFIKKNPSYKSEFINNLKKIKEEI